MLQRSLPGCWQLFCLDGVATIHDFVNIHRAGHNFYPIKKEKKITMLARLPFVAPFCASGTVFGSSHGVFLSANLKNLTLREGKPLTKDHTARNREAELGSKFV